jgi:SAM-dependent methyltransferase
VGPAGRSSCNDAGLAAPMSADLEAYKRGQRELWSSGDYAVTARRFENAAEELVAACGIGPGARVLDIAAGNGNGALAAAATGAIATASDLAPALVEVGRARCAAAGVRVDWTVADAEELPFADGSFDGAISLFGLVLAPRPDVAIAEAFRVTRPGGVVGMTSWTPDSAAARFGAIGARHCPAPASALASPHEWGDEATARERFAAHCGDDVRFELGSVRWSWPSAAAARERGRRRPRRPHALDERRARRRRGLRRALCPRRGPQAALSSPASSACRLKSSRTSHLLRWCHREIAARSSGDSPPEDGEARPRGIRARMPGLTSLVESAKLV